MPFIARLSFLKEHFQHILGIAAAFTTGCRIASFWGAGGPLPEGNDSAGEMSLRLWPQFNRACRGLFPPGCWHIPACLSAGTGTNTAATLQGTERRRVYLGGSSQRCVHVRILCMHVCADACVRVCVRARSVTRDTERYATYLTSVISFSVSNLPSWRTVVT